MATNREMLKEAIADAKAVKETAIANAKVALEEAFTPQLKSMFAAKLQEMASDEDELEEAGFGGMDPKGHEILKMILHYMKPKKT
jgi:TATA-binding protein-associated factor Taf7